MAESVIDFAGLDSTAAASAGVETPAVEEVEVGAEGAEHQEESAGEGSEASQESKDDAAAAETKDKEEKAAAAAKAGKAGDGKATPESISKLLKSMKDADPANAGAAKLLRDSYFGEQAYRKEFPSVQEARQAKEFIAAIGGVEGWESAQGVISNIEETDALVHAGDGQVWKNIVEDLKSEGHIDALPKLAASGLDTLKAENPTEFDKVLAPHFVQGLEDVNLPKAIASLEKYSSVLEKELTDAQYAGGKNGLGALKTIITDMKTWITDLQTEQKAAKDKLTKADPEREALNKDKADFEKQKTERAQADAKTFKEGVARDCDSYSNKSLGAALKPFLKMPFFKDFPRETLVDLGNGIKERLYAELEKDNAYQVQMKGQWKQKTPDKGKITEFHKTKLDAIANDIVEKTIKQRYPGYAKGGTAAGRVAAATAKKEKDTKAAAVSVSTGKPIYVASKPKDLVRDNNLVKDWQMLEITGKGYVKGTDNKLKLVTWRK